MSYSIYAIRDKGEIIYIGMTTSKLSRRLTQHKYRRGLSKDCEIELLCKRDNKIDAMNTETHMINLIGVNRLINKIADTRKAFLGHKHSDEAKAIISKASKAKPVIYGRKMTDKQKEDHSRRLKGLKKGEGLIDKTLESFGHKFFNLYKDGVFIGRFINQTKAAKALSMPKSTFVNILKGERVKTRGIKVVYEC